MAIQNFFSYITYAFYSRYNMVWIDNTEIVCSVPTVVL